MATTSIPVRDETRNVLLERTHAGLWIIVASNALFAVLDLFINRAVIVPLWLIKGLDFAWAAYAFAVLRTRPPTRRVVNMALVTILIVCLSAALSSKLTGDLNSTPLLMVIMSLTTATMFPWGFRPQLVVVACCALSVALNRLWVVPTETTVFAHVAVAVLVAFIAAFWAASTQERYRRERQRAEEVLAETRTRQHQADLAQAARLSALGEMAAGLAHELNQPLSAIVSYARGCALRIRSGAADATTLLEVVEEISSQAFRAGEVLRRIRDFLRHGELQREDVDMNDLAREAARFVGAEAREVGVVVRLDLAPRPLAVGADRIQVEQVMLNLVRNGFDAMAGMPRGERTLTIATLPADGDTIEVTIADTGAGVPAEQAARLFDPFFTTKHDGLGLGLSISRSIIEAHGGRLWVTAGADGGAVFHFTLPTTARGADAA